uniref:Zona pellucida sperm-binding protein 3 n=1 Tax=Acanthochromis polyacanthus TaxID=80966 RepID=A0A3Q1GWE8_9TELE
MTGCMKEAPTCSTSVSPSASRPRSGLDITWGSGCSSAAVWQRFSRTFTLSPNTSLWKMGEQRKTLRVRSYSHQHDIQKLLHSPQMTEDSLVYTNLLIYSPEASPNGLIRMDEAVVPIECHYGRKYSLSSSSLMPTWIPFTSTQAAVETLAFNLRLMTNDWMHERSANMFHLGEPISIEASVRVGHHMGLRVFISSCVATLQPDIYSEPKYIFVENGCLLDSQLPGSKAHFLTRTQDDKLQLVIDAFKFHNDDRGELYITCHLNAVPVNDAEAPNKACTFVNGRWRSADGNDYLCGYCQSEAGQLHSKANVSIHTALFGFAVSCFSVWDHEKRVGPVMVLPSLKSGPLPMEELPL